MTAAARRACSSSIIAVIREFDIFGRIRRIRIKGKEKEWGYPQNGGVKVSSEIGDRNVSFSRGLE